MAILQVNVGGVCIRDVVVAGRTDSVLDVASLMRKHHVGAVVLVEERAGRNHPVGLLTDRDIVIEGLVGAFDRLPRLTAGDLVTRPLVTVREADAIDNALDVMRTAGVRRLPVVDDVGALVGILAVDDLIDVFATRLGTLANVVANEHRNEQAERP